MGRGGRGGCMEMCLSPGGGVRRVWGGGGRGGGGGEGPWGGGSRREGGSRWEGYGEAGVSCDLRRGRPLGVQFMGLCYSMRARGVEWIRVAGEGVVVWGAWLGDAWWLWGGGGYRATWHTGGRGSMGGTGGGGERWDRKWRGGV